MAIKSFNPYSPSRRSMTVSTFEEITTDKPHRPLVVKLNKPAATTPVRPRSVIRATATRDNIVSSISNVRRTISRLKWLRSNTILTVLPTLPF